MKSLTGQTAVAVGHMQIADLGGMIADCGGQIGFFQRHVKQIGGDLDTRVIQPPGDFATCSIRLNR